MWIKVTVLIKVTLSGKTTGWNWRTCFPCWLHGPFKMQRRNNHHSKSQFNKALVPLSPLCRQKLCKTFQGDLIRASTVHFTKQCLLYHPFAKQKIQLHFLFFLLITSFILTWIKKSLDLLCVNNFNTCISTLAVMKLFIAICLSLDFPSSKCWNSQV